jgi:hypothetical protein
MPPSTTFLVRRAHAEELAWVNACYADVDFLASGADDLIVIASSDGAAAGLGRVVPLGAGLGELGGMLVFDGFKGRGAAKQIIASLCALPGFDTLYCLPFAELEGLYASMGFIRTPDGPDVPSQVSHKYRWCNEHYAKPVLLMRRTEKGTEP